MELNIVLAGLGGQGVVFLTRLLARSATALDLPVMVSETHGMSQRGGSVVSHLRIGTSQSPLILRGTADLLFGLEPDEAVRNLPYLKVGGAAFVNAQGGLRSEVQDHLARRGIQVYCVPASQMAVSLGSAAVANVVLAGFAAAHPQLPFDIETLRETIRQTAARGLELNLQALDAGYQAGQQNLTD